MKIKYDAEEDILIFILQDDLPYDAISEQWVVIVSYKEAQETVSIEYETAWLCSYFLISRQLNLALLKKIINDSK